MAHAAVKKKPKPAAKVSAVAKRSTSHLPVVAEPQRPVTILDIINRAAFDPTVDADKIEKLLAQARLFKMDDAKAAYTQALVRMKPHLPVIDRKGCIMIHEKGKEKIDANLIQTTPYALWEDIDAAISPILADHGFALTFRCGSTGAPEHRVTVTGVLSHEMGHSEETTMTLPLDTSGSKNNVQAVGSSTSYGKRYTATLLLNIRTKGEDDDGHAGGATGLVTEEQAETILDLLTRDKADVGLFCKSMKVESIIDLPRGRYREAVERINIRSQIVKQKEGVTP